MFLRNAWYIAAWADEVADVPLARRICDEPIVLFRNASGKAAALTDRCCHRAAPLSMGTCVPEGIQCGYHGLVIDGAGRCVRVPGQTRIPAEVWMGEAEKADPALILDFPYHNDTAHWPNKHARQGIKGNYMLMVDNLMDLTHLGYLHARTVGGNPAQHVDAEMKTERTATGIRFTRWMRTSPPPSYVRAAGFKGRVDRLQAFEFVAPCSILQWTGATDAGSGAVPDDFPFKFRLFHGLTPETETSCHYFWSAANGYRQNEPEATEQLYQEIAPTFVEDQIMVEAQQARLTEFGKQGLTDIATDANRLHIRRFVERMIAAEQSAMAAE